MEEANVFYNQDNTFIELALIFCGRAKCAPLHEFGPAVRPYYILHYILDGSGTFTFANQTFQLQKGQGFIIEPDVVTHYQADEDNPWTYIWIGFEGTNATSHLEKLGITHQNPIFQSANHKELEKLMEEMLLFKEQKNINVFHLQALFIHFLSYLNPETNYVPTETSENHYVQQAIHYIQMNYHQSIRIQEIASFLHVNRSYLSTLFQRQVGQSLQHYILNLRLLRARDLLDSTHLSIETIANSCGYNDSVAFSKAFKRNQGMTPSAFRKRKDH